MTHNPLRRRKRFVLGLAIGCLFLVELDARPGRGLPYGVLVDCSS